MKYKPGDQCLIIGAQYNHQYIGRSVTLRDYYVSKEIQGFEGWNVDGIPPPEGNLQWVINEKHLMKISGGGFHVEEETADITDSKDEI